MSTSDLGILYVVATPIGNRRDLSPRAAEVLTSVTAIVAEDTRHIQRLLGDHGRGAKRVSLHAHNEALRIPGLIERLLGGAKLALVSDAGAPALSDPGGRLVAAAHEAGVPVRVVPGPSAVTAALSVAGLPADRFVFEGFLPTQGRARKARLQGVAREPKTVVLFESPRRIGGLLSELAGFCGGDRWAVVARELTKRFETCRQGTLQDLARAFAEGEEASRGELTVCLAGAPEESAERQWEELDVDTLLETLLPELPLSRAARVAARLTGRSKAGLYRRALELMGEG